jgi:hypothetical protein
MTVGQSHIESLHSLNALSHNGDRALGFLVARM